MFLTDYLMVMVPVIGNWIIQLLCISFMIVHYYLITGFYHVMIHDDLWKVIVILHHFEPQSQFMLNHKTKVVHGWSIHLLTVWSHHSKNRLFWCFISIWRKIRWFNHKRLGRMCGDVPLIIKIEMGDKCHICQSFFFIIWIGGPLEKMGRR